MKIMVKLTGKQENFCIAFLETGNATEAYKIAYPKSMAWKSESVRRKAFDVVENGKIQARMEELRAPVVERARITYESHLDELELLRESAKAAENLGVAVTAETQRGKCAGLYVERVEVKNIYAEMPSHARKTRIAQLLEKALVAVES
jgi:phage terminase small subunit